LPQETPDRACDLSRYAFSTTGHLDIGYPVQFRDPTGYRRGLLGFDATWQADPALFELPIGYARAEMGGRR